MRWPWQKKKALPAEDVPGTPLAPLVDRVEDLERGLARLSDAQKEFEDLVVRRLDKYRKRIERETPAAEQPAGEKMVHAAPGASVMGPGNRWQQMAELRRSGRWPLKGA